MTDRDRLIAIVKDSLARNIDKSCNLAENIVDDLICECVILPPCKVGDKVWVIVSSFVVSFEIEKIEITRQGSFFGTLDGFYWYSFDDFGKTTFHTREEAEKALKEREKDNDSN